MIYTEITPNPASLKFVLDRVVLRHGSADFPSPDLADESPLARKLFEYKFVERVFLGYNFITVTKSADFQWEEVIPAVKTFLKAWLAGDQPIVTGSLAEAPAEEAGSEDDELTRRIKELLETHVRPAVAMDGGDIIYEDFREGTLWLKLQGSCSGCPSSTITLKRGIEGLVTRMVPEVKRVEAV